MSNPRERILAALTYHLSNARHDFRTFCHAGDEGMIKAFEEAIEIVERELVRADRVAALEAENAELRRDRERLEFMSRTQAFVSIEGGLPIKYQVTWSDPCDRDTDWYDDFRDAIDEARGVTYEWCSKGNGKLFMRIARLEAENQRLREALLEAIDSVDEYANYAGDYLRTKHGIDDDIDQWKAALAETGGE